MFFYSSVQVNPRILNWGSLHIVYSNINDSELEDEILDRTSIYLDINHWWEVKDILNRCQQKQIPIYSFDTVAHQPELTNTMISSNHPKEMVQAIQDFLKERDT
ncbi:hypothetical protein HCC04_04860 [Streptococcus suis]|nr:hypothetical protein [Streptococcus suis]